MRILLLAPQPFFVTRGTPIAVRNMIEGLCAAGHEVDAVVLGEGADISVPGLRLMRVPRLPGLRRFKPGFSPKKAVADVLVAGMAAWRQAATRYDLVIAVEEAAFIASALKPIFGVPYIFDVDSSIPEQIDEKFGLPPRLFRAFVAVERWAARRAAGAIACCASLGDLLRTHAPDLPICVLEDVSLLDGEEPGPTPPDYPSDLPSALYVGNLEGYQGVGLLIEAFAVAVSEGAPGRLVIIGGAAADIAALSADARARGLADRVVFLGPRPIERLGDYLRAATFVVSPRLKGRNTPMKVYSYLDSGRPLLATRLQTHTQVLDDTIAHLVEPTPRALADGVQTLFADAGLRGRIAAAAAARVRAEFSRAAYARKLTRFIDEEIGPAVANGRRPRRAGAAE